MWTGVTYLKNRFCASDKETFFIKLHPPFVDCLGDVRDSSVGIETGYRLDGRGTTDFSLFRSVQAGSGAHPTSYSTPTGGSFPGGKVDGERIWHLSPYNAEVNNSPAIPPLSHYAFMAWCLIKHRDNFFFVLLIQLCLQINLESKRIESGEML
jgi:hypothetical protein